MYIESSGVTFEGNCTITFNNNKADSNGGAVYTGFSGTITFEGNYSNIQQ